jgi:hypothetical protein
LVITLSNVTIKNGTYTTAYTIGVYTNTTYGKILDSTVEVNSVIGGNLYGIYAEKDARFNRITIIVNSPWLGNTTGIFSKEGVYIKDVEIKSYALDGLATGIKFLGMIGNNFSVTRSEIFLRGYSAGEEEAPTIVTGIECGAGSIDILHTTIYMESNPRNLNQGIYQTASSSQVNVRHSFINKLFFAPTEASLISLSGVAGANINVSQSTLIGNMDGESTKHCVTSDNGSVLLNPDCTIPD